MTPITPTDSMLERLHLIAPDLIERDQWGVWRNEDGAKIPYLAQHPRRRGRVNVPHEWATFSEAVNTFADWLGRDDQFTGLAYLITADDPFVGVDFDDCVNGDAIHPEAMKLVNALGGYCEISPSQTGLKIWTRGTLNLATTGSQRMGPWGGQIEIYSERRWFAVTGWRVDR